MRTVSYNHVKRLVSARLSQPFTSVEEDNFKALLDDSVRSIYDMEDFWPRYLKVEPRTVKRGYIADTEDSFHVYGAGTEEVNGLYVRNGSQSSRPRYTLFDSDGTTELFHIEATLAPNTWMLADKYIIYYDDPSDIPESPPLDGWETVGGENPSPLVQELGEIGRILHRWDGKKWASAPELLNNYRDANGIRCTNGTQNGTVWLAYKEALPGVFGDGTGDTIDEIPEEFSRYCALRIRYDMADAQRQGNPSPSYLPSYKQVQDAALDAMLGITREGAMETIKNVHRTYYKYDTTAR